MAAISKEEYLKRYLSNADSGEKKKRRKRVKTGVKTGKSLIIDDDVNLSDIRVRNDSESQENLLELAEENPLIFDEAGTTVLSKDLDSIKKKEEEKRAMWAPVRNLEDKVPVEKIDQRQVNAKDLSPTRDKIKKARHDSPSPKRISVNDQEQAKIDRINVGKPRRQRHDTDEMSPPRHSRRDSSSDQSPVRETKELLLKCTRHGPPDFSPQRRNANIRQGSPTDQSPVRRTGDDSSSDQSPPRMQQISRKMVTKSARNDSANAVPSRNFKNPWSRSPIDQSPPRRNRRDASSDPSPPRRNRRDASSDPSPPRRNRCYASSDPSPPRRNRRDASSDPSPPRRNRRDASSDPSPPRRNRRDASSDPSLPRRNRRDASSDQSPPRNRGPSKIVTKKNRHDSPDFSPPPEMGSNRLASSNHSPSSSRGPSEKIPRRTRHDCPDLSLPRRNVNWSASPDQSPPRKQRTISNKNQALNRRHDTPDLSPPRKTTNTQVSPSDQSPPRKQGGRSHKGWHDDGNSSDQSPQRKQKGSERKAGLHSAAELREENERTRQREYEMFSRMSSSATGKGAETVHRDKTGRKRDFKVEEVKKREEERKKQEENEKFMEWGKGVQQSKTAKNKVHDDLYEMSKPLARYKDDTDLDQMLKERDRAGDPMLAFVQKKKVKQDRLAGKKEKPKYKGPAPPPNRFNIPPGYRWDGVDRSNGFEKKRFSMLSNKGATREEAYKWSIEDM